MKKLFAGFLLLTVCAVGQDSATMLARILAGKGTISASELATVEAAADRTKALADLLQQKGLLNATEVARLSAPAPGPAATGTAAPHAPVTSTFPLTFYGTILFNAFSNTALGNVTDIPLFLSKQGSDALGNDKTFGMTARQSRFGLKYESRDEVMGAKLSGQVEVDLLGGSAPFGNGVNMDLVRLRLAFGRLDWTNFSLEAGQDWSVFAPLNPTSLAEYAIPSMSASGNPWIRLPQLRIEAHTSMSDHLNMLLQLAATDPNVGDYSTTTFSAARPPGAGERGRYPGAEGRLALSGKNGDQDVTIGFSGHYSHGKNSGTVGALTEQVPFNSWGAAVDWTVPFSKAFNLTGEAYTGRELGIFSVTSGEALGLVGALGQKGVRSTGGWAQAQFNFARQWQVNAAYGIDDPNVQDLAVGSRTRNQTYMGNLMYKYTPHVTFAWEYRRILTDYRNQPLSNERGDVGNMAVAYLF